jgi:multidrug efflux pump
VIAHFFIDRPIFALVLSIVLVIAGVLAYTALPIAQYPDITPPTISVTATWPGATAEDVASGVSIPIEKEVNGVENSLYMESRCTSDGQMNLTVTFKVGTDLDMAQVLVQNRVAAALNKLPDTVKQTGVVTKKKSPSILLIINFFSKDGSREQIYLSNYARMQIKDEVARVEGVGDIMIFGEREYSMRINLDTKKLAMRNLTPVDVMQAVREQNQQVPAGQTGQPPLPPKIRLDYQNTISVYGRLKSEEEFREIVIKTVRDPQSGSVRVIRLKEVASVELGAKNYSQNCNVDGQPSVGMAIYQLPGSNALETAERVRKKLNEIKLPDGVNYGIYYDTTPFIEESVHEVEKTFRDALILVAIVVLAFLQTWRAALIPLIAVPVSIIGTLAVMLAAGFSLNNLTLFGLVLAIGIVVDDAIVVVEAVEHHMAHGLSARDATRKAMTEVSGPIIAVALVLCAVFVPSAFISGLQGQFFKQFALTIAVSTVISAFNSLTLSPALSALLLKPKTAKPDMVQRGLDLSLGWFFRVFNKLFDVSIAGYTRVIKLLLRGSLVALAVYGGLIVLTGYTFRQVPVGFIPMQDKGYLIVDVQLPDGYSLQHTETLSRQVDDIIAKTPGVSHRIAIEGMSFVTGGNTANTATYFVILDEFSKRGSKDMYADAIALELRKKFAPIRGARFGVYGAPPVDGLGTTAGLKMQLKDQGGLGFGTLQGIGDSFAREGASQPGLVAAISSFRADTPRVRLIVDRVNAKSKGINLDDLFKTLQSTTGSYYINDVTLFDNNFQVNMQARAGDRMTADQIGDFMVRNFEGKMIALKTFSEVKDDAGPSLVIRYNTFPSAAVVGLPAPGTSTGDGIAIMEQIADKVRPDQMRYEWTELTYLQITAGDTSAIVFFLSVVFVFLVLAAQYESWSLPLAVILIVPMCLLSAAIGIAIARLDINIFTQIGLTVLIGLASKNAILIVEFAKQKREEGMSTFDAAVEACRLRLRPILMTSFAFILGVLPLVLAHGAGAEMRVTLGVAVFSGMLGVTFFGIFLTPVFYFVLQYFSKAKPKVTPQQGSAGSDPQPH